VAAAAAIVGSRLLNAAVTRVDALGRIPLQILLCF
jgi:hypothetical protein